MYTLIPDKESIAPATTASMSKEVLPSKSAGKKAINIGCSALLAVLVLAAVAFSFATSPARNPANQVSPAVETSAAVKVLAAQRAIAAQVNLRAKSWDDGVVHVWSDLNESSSTHIDVAENTACTRLDDHTYKMGSGSTAIYYYKLACNGVVGYVERDQVR